MTYNTHLDIANLEENNFKDEYTKNLAALVYMLRPYLNQAASVRDNKEENAPKLTIFVGPPYSITLYDKARTFYYELAESEYGSVLEACQKATTSLFRDKIMDRVRARFTERAEIDQSLLEADELDPDDDVFEFTEDDVIEEVDEWILPRLSVFNLAFYVTYKNQYDLLKLDDIDNTEFWYNEYIDLILNYLSYETFTTFQI